jgi:hypothetical protein
MYAFTPEKTPSLVDRNFCLAISYVFANASKKVSKEMTIAGSGHDCLT